MTETGKSKSDETQRGEEKARKDEDLEQELEDSFPASDPPSATQPNVTMGAAAKKSQKDRENGAPQRKR